MKKHLLLLLLFTTLAAGQPALQTQMLNGVLRAQAIHAATMQPVTDDSPAMPGEVLILAVSPQPDDLAVMIAGQLVAPTPIDDQTIQFTVPLNAQGGFVELSLSSATLGGSPAATISVAAALTSPQLIAADVDALVKNAITQGVGDPNMAIAVVDRAGHVLAIYRQPLATNDAAETALSLARTGTFFSHNQAPLSSRTVAYISAPNFPVGIPNQASGPLFGIENTNRGCALTGNYLPSMSLPQALNSAGTGPGKGVTTIPGGVAIYKNGLQVGGIGVAGVAPDVAEYSAIRSVDPATALSACSAMSLLPCPFPTPFAVYINGVRLPFVAPQGAAAGAPSGAYQVAPRDGQAAPEGWLVAPAASATLSVAEVTGIIQNAIATASRTRAAIRLPVGARASMAISVTDLKGNVLGLYRMPDSTIFSVDVAVSKARNVVYFSSAAIDARDLPGVPAGTAVTNRAIGFGSQPYYPSGINGTPPGPFRDLYNFDSANPCTQGRQPAGPNQSGVVFFPGSAPLYKNGALVGGLGVSGDGVDQDDYVTAGGLVGFEAPASMHVDQIVLRGVRLPYLKFPRNPEQ